MKISDKTDEDVAAILGLIPTAVALTSAEGALTKSQPARPVGTRVAASLAVVFLGMSGLVGWAVIRQSHGDAAASTRAARASHGRSFANVLLDAPTRIGDPPANLQVRTSARPIFVATAGRMQREARPAWSVADHRRAARTSRSLRDEASKDKASSQAFEIAKANSTPTEVASLAFQSDGVGDSYRQSAVSRPNFALTPAARAERLDALDAVRLLRQR